MLRAVFGSKWEQVTEVCKTFAFEEFHIFYYKTNIIKVIKSMWMTK